MTTEMQATYQVQMEDGAEWTVTADQRDAAAFELEPFGTPSLLFVQRLHTYSRYRAWHASVRAGKTALTWEQFSVQCVDVDGVDDKEEPADAADPGNSVASAES